MVLEHYVIDFETGAGGTDRTDIQATLLKWLQAKQTSCEAPQLKRQQEIAAVIPGANKYLVLVMETHADGALGVAF